MVLSATLDWKVVIKTDLPLLGKIELGSMDGSESFEESQQLDLELVTTPTENIAPGRIVSAAYEMLMNQTLTLPVDDALLSTILGNLQVDLSTGFKIKADSRAPHERASTRSRWLLYE